MEDHVMRNKYFKLGILIFSLWVSVNAFAENYPINPKDPYEKFNRVVYHFNNGFDLAILKPIATVYSKVVPKPLSKGISNFFSNLDTIPTVLNDILQANCYQATSDFWRFVINSTAGLLGFIDVASEIGLERNFEDFGLTLAQWGYKDSNYLVLPFLGPSTVRDGIAWPINYQFFTIYPYIQPARVRYQLYISGVISKRADFLYYQDFLRQAAVDKYAFMRDAYLQRRAYLIERNQELGDPYLEKK